MVLRNIRIVQMIGNCSLVLRQNKLQAVRIEQHIKNNEE